MNMIPVASSNLSSVGYENNILFVSFNHGGTYSYRGVPYSVFQNLLNASSKGQYFARNIKNVYPCTKL